MAKRSSSSFISRFFGAVMGLFLSLVGAIILVSLLQTGSIAASLPIRFFIVQSGSMEPAIMTGDLIMVHEQSSYQLRDTITFEDSQNRVVTHRIIELVSSNPAVYLTQGDANQVTDVQQVAQSDIVGAVSMVIPKAGLVAQFAQSLAGRALFIIVPATLLILHQFWRMMDK